MSEQGNEPSHLKVPLLERFIQNNMPFKAIRSQRRMGLSPSNQPQVTNNAPLCHLWEARGHIRDGKRAL